MSENVKRYHIQGWEWEDFEAEDGSWCKSDDVDVYVASLRSQLQEAQESAARAENARVEAEKKNGILSQNCKVTIGWLDVERGKRREFEKGLVAWRKKCHEKMDKVEELERALTAAEERYAELEKKYNDLTGVRS